MLPTVIYRTASILSRNLVAYLLHFLSSEFRHKTKRVELPFLESRSRGMGLGSYKRAYAQIQGSRRFELAQIQSHICPGGESAKRIQPADSWKRGSGREELPRGPWAPAPACRGTPSPPRRRAAAQTATAPAETLPPRETWRRRRDEGGREYAVEVAVEAT